MDSEMRGLIGGIQKFSTEDGPGIRTTVFLKGCPLACKWCHNPELISPGQQVLFSAAKCIGCGECVKVCKPGALSFTDGMVTMDWDLCQGCFDCTQECYAKALTIVGTYMSVEEVMDQVRQDKGFYDNTGGGLTISGGEILMQHDFAEALLDAALEENIGVALDTSGFGDYDSFLSMAEKCDHILYDMKLMGPDHLDYMGVENKVILENLEKLASNPMINNKIIIRMPLIRGVNDSEETISRTYDFLMKCGIKKATLLPYHDLGIGKSRNIGGETVEFQPPSVERVNEIKDLFQSGGISTEVLGQKLNDKL